MNVKAVPRRERLVAIGMAVLVALVAALVLWRAYLFVTAGTAAGIVIGIAVAVITVIGGWLVWRTVAFGLRMQAMARELEADGGLPADELPRRPSGRAERAAADELFEQRRAETEAAPQDWRAWFRLALAYDDAGDRRRAREAARTAAQLHGGRRG